MAVKGAYAKEVITNKILATFTGSFINGKEIRIPIEENGEVLEIKVNLVRANDVLGGNPGQEAKPAPAQNTTPSSFVITEEEKKETQDLLKALGL